MKKLFKQVLAIILCCTTIALFAPLALTATNVSPSLALSPASKTLAIGQSATLKATSSPKGQKITWASSNANIATVSNGKVTAKSIGNATVTAKFVYNGKTYSKACTINVKLKAPTAKVTNVNATTVKISWNKISGANGYYVFRATSKTGKYTRVATVSSASTLSVNIKSLKTGSTYYFKVFARCSNSKGNSTASAIVAGKAKLITPTAKATNVNATTVKISWNKISGANGYYVFRAASKTGTYTRVATVSSASTLSVNIKSLKNGSTYYFKVFARCSNSKGNSSASTPVSIKVEDPAAKKTLIASERKSIPSTGKRTLGALDVEHMMFYLQGVVKFGDIPEATTRRYVTYNFTGDANTAKAIKAYAKSLTSSRFKLVDSSEDIYSSSSQFYSCAIDYTAKVLPGKSNMNFGSQKPGDITIYYVIDGKSLKGQVSYSELLNLVDSGVRYASSTVQPVYIGKSAGAGLYKQGNKYITTDSRLSTTLGKATVVCDGKKYIVNATASFDSKRDTIILATKNYNGKNSFGLISTDEELATRSIYPIEKLYDSAARYRLLNDYSHTDMTQAMDSIIWTLGFAFCHNGKYKCLSPSIDSGIKNAYFRTVYYKKNSVAVIYAAVEFDTAPYKSEMLAAFDLRNLKDLSNPGSSSGSGSGSGSGSSSTSKTCAFCGNKGYKYCDCNNGKVICPDCHNIPDYNMTTHSYLSCHTCNNKGYVDCKKCRNGKVDCLYCSIPW